MSGYKTFAVAGAGNIGKFIVEELVKLQKEGLVSAVKVLTRSADSHPELTALGATPLAVDYTSRASLSSALAGVDVVISTLGFAAFPSQVLLAEVAKEVGVKLFVPSDFGGVTLGVTEGFWAGKEKFRLKLVELGLPYASFFTGPFSDMVFVPYFGFDLANGKATIGYNGAPPITFTARTDIARFVAHVLTALPASKLENSHWRLEGDRISFNDIFAGLEARTGKKISVTHIPKEELEASVKANAFDIKSLLLLNWSDGEGVLSTEGLENAEDVWKEWNPKKVLDVI